MWDGGGVPQTSQLHEILAEAGWLSHDGLHDLPAFQCIKHRKKTMDEFIHPAVSAVT